MWNNTPQLLDECRWKFPPAKEWPKSDLVGRGADLQPETLIHAYMNGVFPMSSELALGENDVAWWSPLLRGVIPLDALRVTRSMRRSQRKFHIKIDTCFERVMRGCASPERPGGWINEQFISAYVELHKLGWAHSVEVFDENEVGDASTYDNPHQYAKGFKYVLVNGAITIENGVHIGTRKGMAIRNKNN